MELGEFIKNFSHNNLVRLVYKQKDGHKLVADSWEDVCMDWKIVKGKGKFRHYINNEVLGLASIYTGGHYPETINIVIEKLLNQPFIEEVKEDVGVYSDYQKKLN
jgi:hypothetical protein